MSVPVAYKPTAEQTLEVCAIVTRRSLLEVKGLVREFLCTFFGGLFDKMEMPTAPDVFTWHLPDMNVSLSFCKPGPDGPEPPIPANTNIICYFLTKDENKQLMRTVPKDGIYIQPHPDEAPAMHWMRMEFTIKKINGNWQ